ASTLCGMTIGPSTPLDWPDELTAYPITCAPLNARRSPLLPILKPPLREKPTLPELSLKTKKPLPWIARSVGELLCTIAPCEKSRVIPLTLTPPPSGLPPTNEPSAEIDALGIEAGGLRICQVVADRL